MRTDDTRLEFAFFNHIVVHALTTTVLIFVCFSASHCCGSETYTQQLTIRFQDAESADRARLRVEPLFDGHHRAVSCRWDDNWTSDNLGARQLMESYGIRGTWYLNDRNFSPENRPADYFPIAKKLLAGGNSIGGHSLTHPFITYFHDNRMFAEMSGVRVVWESALDLPVLSYAYSFVDICPGPEFEQVQQRTVAALTRSGFDHVSEYLNFFEDFEMHQELSPIMPPENRPYDEFRTAVDWAYREAKLTEFAPMITNSMHAWYDTPRLHYGYDELEKRFQYLAALEDVWHCNQNQYAGYRRQFKAARLVETERNGTEVTWNLTRLSVLALNDNSPLTLAITGVSKHAITSIECSDCEISMSTRDCTELVRFHVPHRSQDRLPEHIGHIANPDNLSEVLQLKRDSDFPSLAGGLFVNGDHLEVRLQADSKHSLDRIRVVWRVPMGYEVKRSTEYFDLNGTQHWQAQTDLIPSENANNRWGREHFVAQVDFILNGTPGRLHFTCERPGTASDDSLPREGFRILGPIDPNTVTIEVLQKMANDNWTEGKWEQQAWRFSKNDPLPWRENGRDGYVTQEWLNPEYVRTTGSWDAVSPTYALRSKIWSPEKRLANLMVSHPLISKIYIDGNEVAPGEVMLSNGENKILILYPGCTLGVGTQRLTACFVRLSDPATGTRLKDIRYQPF